MPGARERSPLLVETRNRARRGGYGIALERGGWSRPMLALASLPVPMAAGIACALLLAVGLLATVPWGRRARAGAPS